MSLNRIYKKCLSEKVCVFACATPLPIFQRGTGCRNLLLTEIFRCQINWNLSRRKCAAGALPLPMGEVPPKGAERALSVTANAVPAPPKGEPRVLRARPSNPNLSVRLQITQVFSFIPEGDSFIVNCQFSNLLLTHTTKTFPRICEKVFSARESFTASAARA